MQDHRGCRPATTVRDPRDDNGCGSPAVPVAHATAVTRTHTAASVGPRPAPFVGRGHGASSGIGVELARQFVSNGFDVLAVAEDAGVSSAAAGLDADGRAEAFRADLRDPAEVERVWAHVVAGGRPLAAAALDAGVGNAGAFVETALDADADVIALNVSSTVHPAKRVLADMGFEALMAGKDHVVAGSARNRMQATLAKVLPVT